MEIQCRVFIVVTTCCADLTLACSSRHSLFGGLENGIHMHQCHPVGEHLPSSYFNAACAEQPVAAAVNSGTRGTKIRSAVSQT